MFRVGFLDPKPKRPYRSLVEYRTKVLFPWSTEKFFQENPSKWPCLHCEGHGKIYDPNDPPCPIEGNKLRDRITCPKCDGTCCSTRAAVAEAYAKVIEAYFKKRREWEERKATLRSAWHKLTPAERKIVGLI